MKFAFYESLPEAAQILLRGVFRGGVNCVSDTGLRLTFTRHGRTVTMNDGHAVTVVVHIPQWIRDGKPAPAEEPEEREDKQRCNHCMSVFDEELTECPTCGRDDALMCPFVSSDEDMEVG